MKSSVRPIATETFDATLVDSSTVVFGPNNATDTNASGDLKDIDGDGDIHIPTGSDNVYNKSWISLSDWLGTK